MNVCRYRARYEYSIAFWKIYTDCVECGVLPSGGTVELELLHDLCSLVCLLAISQAYNDDVPQAQDGICQWLLFRRV